jgi:hypothetical protein
MIVATRNEIKPPYYNNHQMNLSKICKFENVIIAQKRLLLLRDIFVNIPQRTDSIDEVFVQSIERHWKAVT